MAIINNTYFKNDIYIPKAKPSITDDVTALPADIVAFINEYERDCLIKCLGLSLYLKLEAEFDFTQANLLKVTADSKWNELLNGKELYINSNGLEVNWRGIRYKSVPSSNYDKSLLAYYIYFFYEEDNYSTVGSTGHQVNDAKNATTVSSRPKAVKAWRKFYEMVVGVYSKPKIYEGLFGYGIDYSNQNSNSEVSLYTFIEDMNKLDSDTYENFSPFKWKNANQLDI